jgi:glucosamine kinase
LPDPSLTSMAEPGAPSQAVIGIDAGGSKTKGLRVEGGRVMREALAGSANIPSVGLEEAGRQLDLLLDRLGRNSVTAACIGAAGADTPEGEELLRRLLQDELPEARVLAVHDAPLVLAAAGLESGVVLISGTGSVAWGLGAGGERARAGGWGHLLGDEGSGFGIAREAVRHALTEMDRERSPDRLTGRLLLACGLSRPDQLLDLFYENSSRRDWADRARVVFELAEAGDPASTRIVAEAAAALAELVAVVTRRTSLLGPVVLAGGLLVHQALLQSEVRRRLRKGGIADVRLLDAEPVVGAVRLAERLVQHT